MSVFIKGMKMPKAGQAVEIAQNVDGNMFARLEPSFDSWHEIIEVPTPHGRLIDIETLKDDTAVLLERNEKLIDDWLAYSLEDVIDGTPTIIEAEEK